jgi:hypothetical protein
MTTLYLSALSFIAALSFIMHHGVVVHHGVVIVARKLYLRLIDGAFSYSTRTKSPGTRAAQADVPAEPL